MPIPYVLIGVAAVTGVFGIGKNIQAGVRGKKAKDVIKEAQRVYSVAEESFDKQRNITLNDLDEYGKVKLTVWSNEMTIYLDYFLRFKKVVVKKGINTHEVVSTKEIKCDITNMTRATVTASEIVKGGVASLGVGAIAGIATYGGTILFAHATTGTAIATLSGAAQTNAALAFIGGGAKAAGGLGMAGGSAVLGGVIVGPILAVQGLITSAKAKEHLAQAERALSEAYVAAEKMKLMEETLRKISETSVDYKTFVISFCERYKNIIDGVKAVYEIAYQEQSKYFWNRVRSAFGRKIRVDFNKLSEENQKYLQYSWLTTQILFKILSANIMNEDGSINTNAMQQLNEARSSTAMLMG